MTLAQAAAPILTGRATARWPSVRLGEILRRSEATCTIRADETYSEITVRLWGRGVVLRQRLEGTRIGSPRRFVARADQLILSRIDARNGALGIVPRALDGAVVSNDFPLFDTDAARALPSFLGWLVKTAAFVELCRRASEGTTNRVRLQEARFLDAEIPLPPLPEQRRIVAKLDGISAKVDETKTIRSQATSELALVIRNEAQRIFASLATYPTRPLGSVCRDIIDCLHSNPIYSETGIPTLRSPDVGWGVLHLSGARRTDEREYQRRTRRGEPQVGDLVLVREGGGTGRAAIVEPDQRFSLGQRVMLLRPTTESVEPRFLLHQWLSPRIQDEHIEALTKGSASPHLNISAIRDFPIALPPLDVQRKISAHLDSLGAVVGRVTSAQARTKAELEALMPAILDRAFKGEL